MDVNELAHRLRERWRIEVDRVRFQTGLGVREDIEYRRLIEGHTSIMSYLEHGPARRFYAGAKQRSGLAALMQRRFPDWMQAAVEEANRLCRREINLLAYANVALGPVIDWHRDPVSGYTWTQRFWAAYDLVNSRSSDPKIVHELNRHQHIPRLAKAYFLTGDERYSREAVEQLDSWIDQNPPGLGVNWQSSLEIAIRSISWMWAVFFLLPSAAFDETAGRRILASLFRQLDHVHRYPSVYSSPNTHLLGEATALFIAGLIFPELPRALKWRQFGAATLIQEMAAQVSTEGVYREASTYYHCYAADFYLQSMALARSNGFHFPGWMWERLRRMFEFVQHVSRPDGSIPLIGDDDGGRALALNCGDYSSYRDGLSSAAVIFESAEFKFAAGGFAEETAWLLGEKAVETFDALEKRPPRMLGAFYPETGCCIQRSDSDPDASHLVFDCGGLGMLTGGHGHADALAVTLFSRGQELLIDPGTSVYNCAPHWRNFFRSTRAHNTVVVDGLDQSEPAGTFSWSRKAGARVVAYRILPGMDYIEAEHDGYSRLRHSVIHGRRLLFVRPNYWILLDELQGRGVHRFDFLYHFAPGAQIVVFGDEGRGDVDCRIACGEAALDLHMYATAPVRAEASCSQLDPIQGWMSRRYGDRRPSPVLTVTLHAPAPAAMMTFLAPERGAALSASARMTAHGGNVVAASFTDHEYVDTCVFSPDGGETRLAEYSMQGEVFWLRTQCGMLKRLTAINAVRFSMGREVIFENGAPMPYAAVYLWDNGMVIERGDPEGRMYVRDLRDRQFQRS